MVQRSADSLLVRSEPGTYILAKDNVSNDYIVRYNDKGQIKNLKLVYNEKNNIYRAFGADRTLLAEGSVEHILDYYKSNDGGRMLRSPLSI